MAKTSRLGKRRAFLERLMDVNRELWLLLSLFAIAGLLNLLIAPYEMILGFFTLPTIFSAYVYGRRHAVLTACASVLLVLIVFWANHDLLPTYGKAGSAEQWLQLIVWGSLLNVIAYAMGTLYERKENHVRELRRTYFGILSILQQFISNDKYTHNHSYRVSIYAAAIATTMGFDDASIDDIRAAALLHDIGKLETSREILHKAAGLTDGEMQEMRAHVKKGASLLGSVGGSLGRVLPIVLAHHEKFDGSGYECVKGEEIPIEARILAVADAYDTLTSDRPYRRAITPFEAKYVIVKNSTTSFDPSVVNAFVETFDAGRMEIPDAVVLM